MLAKAVSHGTKAVVRTNDINLSRCSNVDGDIPYHIPCLGLGMAKCALHVVDGCKCKTSPLENLRPLGGGLALEDRVDDGVQDIAVLDSLGIGGEALVLTQRLHPQHFAKLDKLLVISGTTYQIEILGRERIVRDNTGMLTPPTLRFDIHVEPGETNVSQ